MKLGALRAAIRAEKNVAVPVEGMTVLVQKGSLLDALGAAHEGKGTETGFALVDGILRQEGAFAEKAAAARAEVLAAGAPDGFDSHDNDLLDDLL